MGKFVSMLFTGMLILIIASDSNTISDTFGILLSVSEILLWKNITIGINDYFSRVVGIDYRQYIYLLRLLSLT